VTGAGASTVAWTPETSYLGGVSGTPTYRVPGTNVRNQTAELDRNLAAVLLPGDIETNDWVAQNIGGQLNLQWVLTDDEFHRFLFNDGAPSWTSGSSAASAEWYLGVDHLSGTVERQIKGWVPVTCTVDYNGSTELTTVSVTGVYGAEETNTSITPGTLVDNSGDEVPGHGAELDINSTRVGKLQSASISLENLARLQFDSNDPKPTDAVVGNVQQSIDLSAIFEGADHLEYALGSAGATTIEDFVDQVSAITTFSHDATTVADYSFARAKPSTYDWQDLVNNEADLEEAVTLNAAGITPSDPTA
jgi:hypothetical protein